MNPLTRSVRPSRGLQDGSLAAEAGPAMVAAISSLALERESLACGRQPQSETGRLAARTRAATVFGRRDEVHRLSAARASTRQEATASARQYRDLRYSRLGRITVR